MWPYCPIAPDIHFHDTKCWSRGHFDCDCGIRNIQTKLHRSGVSNYRDMTQSHIANASTNIPIWFWKKVQRAHMTREWTSVCLCCSPLPQPALLQRGGSTGGEFGDIRRGEATVRKPLSHPDKPLHSWRPQQPDNWAQVRPQVQTLSVFFSSSSGCTLNLLSSQYEFLSSPQRNKARRSFRVFLTDSLTLPPMNSHLRPLKIKASDC